MHNLQNTRVAYLDSMRGILMLLVVFYHSSLVFSPNTHWVVNSPNTIILAYGISQFLILFIMPLFFIISGYFALMGVKKYTPEIFITKRLKRIFIPLLVSTLTLNVLQALLAKGDGWYEYYTHGGWISHLWFLWNLVFYFILIYIDLKFLKLKYTVVDLFLSKLNIYTIVLLLPFLSIALLVIGKILPATVLGVSISAILYFLPYFIFGILLYTKNNLIHKFISMKKRNLIILTIFAYTFYSLTKSHDGIIFLTIGIYFQSLAAWLLSSLSFNLFYNFVNKPSKILNTLSNASYTIYLFHHVLVVFFALILIEFSIGGILGMFLLVLLASLSSLLIHIFLISKFNVLSFLYNGK